MSEAKCRVCGEPEPEGFCRQCEWDRAAECVLFEKSDSGELTAGELPVGATFKVASFGERALRTLENKVGIVMAQHDVLPTGVLHFAAGAIATLISLPNPESAPARPELVTLGELNAGEWFVFHEIECKDVLRVVSSEAARYVHTENQSGVLEAWLSYRRVRRVPAPGANAPAAPPDSELPTYDEVMAALGERWTVCCNGWTCMSPALARLVAATVSSYPGPWLLERRDGLPYLNLQRDDGQRVRFEVPGYLDPQESEPVTKHVIMLWLEWVTYGERLHTDEYNRHVRWLPIAESQTKALAAKVDRLEAATGQRDHESLTTVSNAKALPSNITMKDIMETAEQIKKYASPVSDDRPELTWKLPRNPLPLTTKALSDTADRIRPGPDLGDMLRDATKRKLVKRSAEILGNWLGERVMLGVDLAADEDVGGISVRYECAPCRTCKKNRAGPSGQCLGCRWRNVPADQVPRLERLLAEQVASGGTDCDASRSLLVRRERLIAEEQERAEHLEERRAAYRLQRSRFLENIADDCRSPRRGIRDDMPKPLIAYKRRGR